MERCVNGRHRGGSLWDGQYYTVDEFGMTNGESYVLNASYVYDGRTMIFCETIIIHSDKCPVLGQDQTGDSRKFYRFFGRSAILKN